MVHYIQGVSSIEGYKVYEEAASHASISATLLKTDTNGAMCRTAAGGSLFQTAITLG